MSSIIIGILNGSVSSIVSITTNVVKIGFGFLISIYILLDKERFITEVKTITYMIFKEERGTISFFWTYGNWCTIYPVISNCSWSY